MITYERYYSEDSSFGVYTFTTNDDIPEYSEYRDSLLILDEKEEWDDHTQKMSILAGNLQRLCIGGEYEVTAELSYNSKFKSYQYKPSIVLAKEPKDKESQQRFLESIVTEKQATTLLKEYPDIVNDVIKNEDNVDLDLLPGIGQFTWNNIREKIVDNYIISDILSLLQPLGVSYKMIQKLISGEPNPVLLKRELLDNPYMMTRIKGLGFKKVDGLALKLNPDVLISDKRVYAFLQYFFHEIGESEGHTWVTEDVLKSAVVANIPDCIDLYKEIAEIERQSGIVLHFDGNRVGLNEYYGEECYILERLQEINSFDKNYDIDVECAIEQAETELGFTYTEEQKDIIHKSLQSNVVFISGKAGTGKTSIMRAIIKAYKNYQVSAAALSAKAAQRITEATGCKATTIHRMLGWNGKNFNYSYDIRHPSDVIFIDEGSMINAPIFKAVFSIVKEGGRVIVCGDHRQLPPIGHANIFSDMLLKTEQFSINKLSKVLRQAEKSGILTDANKIRECINPLSSPELKVIHGENKDMVYMFRDNREGIRNIAIKTLLSSIEQDGLDETIIITPRKKDCENSTTEINNIILDALIPDTSNQMQFGKKFFRVGAKVIQRENNYDKNIFNGEVGYITSIYDEQQSEKEKIKKFTVKYKMEDSEKEITYTRNELDQIDLAYALTAHLCQGSGYKTVIAIIDNSHYIMLDSCLLYTMLTRAKQRCLLLAEPQAFIRCVNNNKGVERQTWLKDM